jgi:osmoprotectant transport system substrate-binding protein
MSERTGRVLGIVAATVLTACTSTSQPVGSPSSSAGAHPVVVASFNFAESTLLAEIYAQSLEHAGIPVRRELDLGPRELVRPALQRGIVDVVPEYLGTALTALQPAAIVQGRPRAVVLTALRQALAPLRLTALTPAAAEDQNGFAVTARTARRLDLQTLSDLARVAPQLVLGGASECPTRPLCLAGLRRVYGMRFKRFEAFDDQQQRATALEQGVIDAEVTFTTDPHLADGSIVLLRDDKGLQPVESVVPIVTTSSVRRYGSRLTDALNVVSAQLDSRALTFLNWRVGVAGKAARTEARGWLRRHGLLGS